MSDLPAPRERLIALHAGRGPRRREVGRSPRDAGAAAAAAEIAAAASTEMAAAAALGARLVTLVDPDYPPALAAIERPPPVLAVRGRMPSGPAVAIVGSRLGDVYGREVASRFARHLAAAGVVIVSGLARGIDAAAHEGALAAPGGLTVAVLGCGLGIDYPRGHARLAAAIAARGAVVSELPCGTAPRRRSFPVRNRVIAALAGITLVVQATPRSGSLSTARYARDLRRLVFAVPGPVFEPLSWGPHSLLRAGALLAGHPEDLLDALLGMAHEHAAPARATAGTAAAKEAPEALELPQLPQVPELHEPGEVETSSSAAVLAALQRGSRTAEQVAARAGVAAETVLAALFHLEIAGLVERLPGMAFRLVKAARGTPGK